MDKRILPFFAVRFSTKKTKKSSFKREWLMPFPADNLELARQLILQALRPSFKLGEFDRYELADIGYYSFANGSFGGKPSKFIDITTDVKTLLDVLSKENENQETK